MDITNSQHLLNAGLIVNAAAVSDPDAPLSTLTNYPYVGFSCGNDGREGELANFLRGFFNYCDGLFLPQFIDNYIDEADCGVNSLPEQFLRFLEKHKNTFEFECHQTGNATKPAYVVYHKELTKEFRQRFDFDERGDYTISSHNLTSMAALVDEFAKFIKTNTQAELHDLLLAQRYIAIAMVKHF